MRKYNLKFWAGDKSHGPAEPMSKEDCIALVSGTAKQGVSFVNGEGGSLVGYPWSTIERVTITPVEE